MWISDFAIRKPIITTVVMLALVVFGVLSLLLLDTDEFPEVKPPVVDGDRPLPGRLAGDGRARGRRPLEEAFASISGVDKIQSTSIDGFALDHRRVRVREGPAAGHPGHPRQDLGGAPATCRSRWRSRCSRASIRTTCRSCRSRCRRRSSSAAELTRLADPASDRRAARRAGRRRRQGRRRRRARAHRRARTRRARRPPASASARSSQALQRAEPRGAGRARHRATHRGAHDPPARPARRARSEFEQLVVAARGRARRAARRRRDACATAPRSRARRAFFNGAAARSASTS